MHIEKNVCDKILGTLLNISGKSKDHLEARFDLQEQNIRKPLHLVLSVDRKSYEIRPAIFDMTKKEKEIFCSVLKNAKLPFGCASNISRYVSISEKKVVRSKPEGSIAEGYLAEERVTFGSRFLTGEGETEDTMSQSARNTSLEYHIGTRKNQDGKVFKLIHVDWKAFHHYVIFNSGNNEIECLIREHRVSLDGEETSKRFKRERTHNSDFWIWLKAEVLSKESISRDLESSQVQQVFYVQDPIQKIIHYVIKKLPRDACDAENENATEEEIRNTTLDDLDIDPGIEFEVGDGSCFRDDVPQIQIPFLSP
ncbi:hypothetical protein AgCh_013916 [Apium graveolens]